MVSVTRRQFAKLVEILSTRGLLLKALPALCIFEVVDAPSASFSAASTDTLSTQADSVSSIQSTLSSYIRELTQEISNFTTWVSQTAFTVSADVGANVQGMYVSYTASGGMFASMNFHNGNYVIPTGYTMKTPGGSTSLLPSVSVSVGGNIGLGDVTGFTGNATTVSITPITLAITITTNHLGFRSP
jgi:hypothetical protein